MLKLSSTTNLHSIIEGDISAYIREELAFQKELGFDSTDFSLHRLLGTRDDDCMPIIDRALADAEEFGMNFDICHLPFSARIAKEPSELPAFCKLINNRIDLAARLGVKYAVVHPNTTTLAQIKFDKEREFNKVIDHLAPLVEHAARVGVNIVVENMRPVPETYMVHRFCQAPDELCEVADNLGIGVCWDFGHANIAGLRQSEALEYVGKRLKVLHVNDNFGEDDVHLPPFVGNIDWKDAMMGVARAGFDGLFNYEVATTRVPKGMRRSFAEYLVDASVELRGYFDSFKSE